MTHTFSNGYAVVIGVGADLPVTVKDAEAVTDLLRDPTRCAYPNQQVCLLTDEKARGSHIIAALEWLAKSTGQDDTAIVYFSGHGVETPDYFLVPYGFDWQDLENTAISGTRFTALLRAIQAKKLIVFLDCCHAAGQAAPKAFSKSPLPPSVVQAFSRSSGRVVIASSRKDQLSWTGTPYSVFTTALLEAFAGYGAFEQDGFVRILDVAQYVGRVVPNRTNEKQLPIIKVSNLEDNFPIAWYAAGNTKPKELPWTQIAVMDDTSRDDPKISALREMVKNLKEAILLLDERMSEYVLETDIPLQLVKSRRQHERKIQELEDKLRGYGQQN